MTQWHWVVSSVHRGLIQFPPAKQYWGAFQNGSPFFCYVAVFLSDSHILSRYSELMMSPLQSDQGATTTTPQDSWSSTTTRDQSSSATDQSSGAQAAAVERCQWRLRRCERRSRRPEQICKRRQNFRRPLPFCRGLGAFFAGPDCALPPLEARLLH